MGVQVISSSRSEGGGGGSYLRGEGLRATYGTGRQEVTVLEHASLAVERDEVVAVVGPSGSGKTTLLGLLGGLDSVRAGRLVVDGAEISSLDRSALGRYRRTHVGFVFQFFHLLPTLTVLENVHAGLAPLGIERAERRRRADAALDGVGLADKRKRFPHQLSGGEQQRVAVARAWAKDPPLLLADEPTGNLDEEGSARVLDLLFGEAGVSHGRTVIVATHDPQVWSRAGRTLRIHDRRIVEDA